MTPRRSISMLRARLASRAGLGPGDGPAAHGDDDERRPGRGDLRRQRGQPVAHRAQPRVGLQPRRGRAQRPGVRARPGLARRGRGDGRPVHGVHGRQRRRQVPEQRTAAEHVPDLRRQDRRDLADDGARQQRHRGAELLQRHAHRQCPGLRRQQRRHRLGPRAGHGEGQDARARRARAGRAAVRGHPARDAAQRQLHAGQQRLQRQQAVLRQRQLGDRRRDAVRRPARRPPRTARAGPTTTASTSPTASRPRSRPTATPRTPTRPTRCPARRFRG